MEFSAGSSALLYLYGVTQPDGTFQSIVIDQARLQVQFADKVLTALRDAELLSLDDIDNIKNWRHSGFNVYIGEPIVFIDQQSLLFVARYLRKCPLSNERLTIIEHPTGEPASSIQRTRTERRVCACLQYFDF